MNALTQILSGQTLSKHEAKNFMTSVRKGELANEITSSTLAVMSFRGETPDEIVGMVEDIFENLEKPFEFAGDTLDVCGTGGDGSGTFNISTTAALLLASCDVNVVKHGNVSVSSRSGSADMLKALGLPLPPPTEVLHEMLSLYGFAFFFAPAFHQSFKNVASIRKKMRVKTVFNLLGPLVNPMQPSHQMIGVYHKKFISPVIESLRLLGRKRAVVVSAESGFDEFSTFEKSYYGILDNGNIEYREFDPTQLKLSPTSLKIIAGDSPEKNAEICRKVLEGAKGPQADIVNFNAGAGLFTAGVAKTIKDGFYIAQSIQESGKGFARVQKLVDLGAHHAE